MAHPGGLMQLLSGSLYSAILCAAAELRVAEVLTGSDGAPQTRSGAELAGLCGAGEAELTRLLRALSVLGLVEALPDGSWRGREVLAFLREDADGGLRALALLQGEPAIGGAWQRCADAIKSGRSGFELAHGKKMFELFDEDPRLRSLFQRSLRGSAGWNEAVVDVLALTGRTLLVDVGGGDGQLAAALVRRWPGLAAIVFDRPGVAGMAGLAVAQPGVEARAGDFFVEVPEGDVHLLRWVLHDWNDDEARRILQRCRASLRPGGVVYLVENLLDEDPGAALLDLSMMILTGGRERTRAEFAALLERAGLRLQKVLPTKAGVKILEATTD
jgi:SAM-dependent methyltransferase